MAFACENGHLAICQLLCKAGAAGDATKPDKDDDTPMHNACRKGHLAICDCLYEAGAAADISKANKTGT